MAMDYAKMQLKDVAALPGVKDLPLLVRGRFAQALQAEAEERHDDAANLLDVAVQKEQGGQ